MATAIQLARPEDLAEVLTLLAANHLPLDGLAEHVDTLLVARNDGRVIGSTGLEMYADGALLRSVAVLREARGCQLGSALVDAAIRMAAEYRVQAVYLLTTTATEYFLKRGFERIAREEVPATVQASVEFMAACPASATVMRRWLSSADGLRNWNAVDIPLR
jgi:amino-acid N-acetyltransferase